MFARKSVTKVTLLSCNGLVRNSWATRKVTGSYVNVSVFVPSARDGGTLLDWEGKTGVEGSAALRTDGPNRELAGKSFHDDIIVLHPNKMLVFGCSDVFHILFCPAAQPNSGTPG